MIADEQHGAVAYGCADNADADAQYVHNSR